MDLVLKSALVASLVALLLPWLNADAHARRRRKQVASALVFELRTYKRHAENLEAAAEKNHHFRDIGFSRHLYEAVIVELPSLGADQFFAVRAAYQQLAQVDFLLRTFAEPLVDTGLGGRQFEERVRAEKNEKLGEAFTVALRTALTRIDAALEALRMMAPRKAFKAPLPEITELTAKERALFGATGQ